MESLIMFSVIWNACKNLCNRVKETIKNITKPATVPLVAGAVTDITRNRQELVVENAILRHQLIVLKRQGKRPKFTQGDRLRLLFLSRLT
jgi:putative transposase